jgi:hypothetical protein
MQRTASGGFATGPAGELSDLQVLWRRRWIIVAAGLVATIIFALTALLAPRRYSAVTTLATVTSRTGLADRGLAASLLGAQAIGGVQPTPAFVTRLFRLPGVMERVAQSPAAGPERGRLIDALERRDSGKVNRERALETMRKVISVTADGQTGLITVRAVHRDSANIRLAVTRFMADVSQAFRNASRAQAVELRQAQEARVDSAARRLAVARERLVRFASANRIVAPYSIASVQREQLEQDVRLAETVYGQAVSDRESAAAKELEETPALVIVDPLPAVLPREPRGTVWRSLLGLVLGALGSAAVLLGDWRLRARREAELPVPVEPRVIGPELSARRP